MGSTKKSPDIIKFIISGTNPSCVERHAIFGADNPIYDYFSVSYLGPLKESEGGELLSSYGRRMGLNWSARAMRRALEDTGGHPSPLAHVCVDDASQVPVRSQPVTAIDDDAQKSQKTSSFKKARCSLKSSPSSKTIRRRISNPQHPRAWQRARVSRPSPRVSEYNRPT